MNTTQQPHEGLIMVVDDNHEFVEGVELILDMEGFKVWRAANGREALDSLEKVIMAGQVEPDKVMSQLPDLILADIMMPVMDGYEFYRAIQDNPYLNEIPFIFLSAKSGDDDIRFGKQLGPDDYLTKPCNPEDMLATIRGKLKRVEQRREIQEQIFGQSIQTPKSGGIIAIAIIGGLVLLAFCIGILVASNWF